MPATRGWIGLIHAIVGMLLLFASVWTPPKAEHILTIAGVVCVAVAVLVWASALIIWLSIPVGADK